MTERRRLVGRRCYLRNAPAGRRRSRPHCRLEFVAVPPNILSVNLTRLQKLILFWLLAGVCAVAVVWQFDDAVGRALILRRDAEWHPFAVFCSKIGEGWVVIVAGLVGAGLFLWLKKNQLAAQIFFVAFTSSIAGLTATILRTLIGRARPNNHAVPQGVYGVWHDGHWIIGQAAFSSLPSGHAATAAGVAAAAWLVNRAWGMAGAVYALAVMWSRIALECHHLSDVTASFFLAVGIALLLRARFSGWNEQVFLRLSKNF